MLLSSPEKDARVKIIDFGTSEFCAPGQKLQDKFGTPYYVAPEVSRGGGWQCCLLCAECVTKRMLLITVNKGGCLAAAQDLHAAWSLDSELLLQVRRKRRAAQRLRAVLWWLHCTSVVILCLQVLGKKGHNVQVDIWSAGVILYILL